MRSFCVACGRLSPLTGRPTEISPDAFLDAIAAAFTASVVGSTDSWREGDLSVESRRAVRAADVDQLLRSQIIDLQDAEAAGLFDDDMRSFGRLVRRTGPGARATSDYWVNWDPYAFVECGSWARSADGNPEMTETADLFQAKSPFSTRTDR